MTVEYNEYELNLNRHLDDYLKEIRDELVVNYLRSNYIFYAFCTENLESLITKNHKYFAHSGIFLNFFHDNLRALITLYSSSHLSPLAFIGRALFEARVNASYIFQDPMKRFDLYYRYSEVEKYNHDKDQDSPRLSKDEIIKIVELCPEWVSKRKNGALKMMKNWTGDEKLNIWQLSKLTGLEDDFKSVYNLTSIYIHCSPLVHNAYVVQDSYSHSIPISKNRELLAITTAFYGIKFLREIYNFFGIVFPMDLYDSEVGQHFFLASNKYRSSIK